MMWMMEGAFLHNAYPSIQVGILNVHLHSSNGIDDVTDGPFVRQKRLNQAQLVAKCANDYQLANPTRGVIVLGDFNATQFTDGYVDVFGC